MGFLKQNYCFKRRISKSKSMPNSICFQSSMRKIKTLLNSQLEEECLKEEQKYSSYLCCRN